MGLRMTGQVLGVNTRTVTPRPGDTWDPFETTSVRVFNGRTIEYLTLGSSFDKDAVPPVGSYAAFDVSVRSYVSKDNKARLEFTAFSFEPATSDDVVLVETPLSPAG